MNKYTKFLQHHSPFIYLLFILIAIAGALAYFNLPSDVYPELSFPRIAVIANVGDSAPGRVLLTVTRLLEEAAGQVYRVNWIRSKTIRGSTELSVDFQPGTDMVFALHQLQARIAEVQSKLPAGVSLTIELVTPAIFPVLSYNLTTDSLTQGDLYTIARYQIQPGLTRAPGVARVQIQGGDIPQVAVEVDPNKLKGYGLSISQVADALKKTNQIQVVGRLNESHQQNLVVAIGEAQQLQDLGNIVVATRNNEPIYLKDLAHISNGVADRLSLVSIENKPGVVVNIFRQPSSNVVDVSNGVKVQLQRIEKSLPPGIKISAGYDESSLVRSAMGNVRDAIFIGIFLIFIVLFSFLHSWRATLIASLAIPLSALAAFGILYLSKQSLNLMSLGGLAVAIGLVIDDAIVVVENIDRQLRLDPDPIRAVTQALSELIGPITSSTATTVVVFLPLGLLSGVAGQFFTSLTITLSAAVIFSWFLALTLTPLLSSQLLETKPQHLLRKESGDTPSANLYAHLLTRALKQPIWISILAVILFAGAIFLFNQLGSDFLPKVDEGSYVVDYFAQPGASLQEVGALALKVEHIIAKSPEVKTWTRRTGAELGLFATEASKGDILVVLKPEAERKRTIDDIMESQRILIANEVPELEIHFHQILQDQLGDLSGAPSPVEVRIYGEDANVLHQLSQNVEKSISTVPGLVDINSTGRESAPEIDLLIDPLRAGRIGLAPTDVSQQVQDSILGRAATQMRQGDRLIDVRVRVQDPVRLDPQQLSQLPIVGVNGVTLPLAAVATISRKAGEQDIFCENQQRYVSVDGNIEGRDLGSVINDVQKQLRAFHLPIGYSISVAGLWASQRESFTQLIGVLVLAISLVYMLLVLQFRSFIRPIAIFIAIPLALFGVEFALWLTRTPFNVSSFMGIILLIGLVVKNGIILLEYTNQLMTAGIPLEKALVQAGKVRLRPILMTTICTILGLLPLTFAPGAGAQLQKPLAIAVIGGLSLSTIFTLFFVPSVYQMMERLANRSVKQVR